ncbi:MAG: cation:proton antiporter regulatory subunit [Actinomycetota bacterium]
MKLPGVGVRYEFQTGEGRRIGVISHRSGLREIYVSRSDDPDEFKRVLGLSPDDARTLAELLGATRVAQQLAELQQRIEGLVIDWLPVRDDSPYASRTIGDAQLRSRTGVSVVAIVRGEEAIPAPGPEARLESGDYLVVVGTGRGVEQAVEVLRAG